VHLPGGARKTPLVGDRQEDAQRSDVHNRSLLYRKYYHFDFYAARTRQSGHG
jgi:hypothetical protein